MASADDDELLFAQGGDPRPTLLARQRGGRGEVALDGSAGLDGVGEHQVLGVRAAAGEGMLGDPILEPFDASEGVASGLERGASRRRAERAGHGVERLGQPGDRAFRRVPASKATL